MPEEKKENKAPSPLLLAVLAVAVIFVVVDFLKKDQTPSPEPVHQAPEARVDRVLPALPEVKEKNKTAEKVVVGAVPPRDPFLPPAVVRRARAQQASPRPTAATPEGEAAGVRSQADSSRPQPAGKPAEPAETAEPVKPAGEPVWTGTMAAAGEQVVIIQHKNKSYILQLGDKVPETDYRVDEIQQEMVVLRAPGKELRLQRKEEA